MHGLDGELLHRLFLLRVLHHPRTIVLLVAAIPAVHGRKPPLQLHLLLEPLLLVEFFKALWRALGRGAVDDGETHVRARIDGDCLDARRPLLGLW